MPRQTSTTEGQIPSFLEGGGEAGSLIRAFDWAKTPLGPAEDWPQVLKTLVALMLSSRQPMFVVWGPERITLYNDSYAEILANKHPAMGERFDEMWHEIWEKDLAPIVHRAYAGEPIHMDDIPLTMLRRGYPEETHFSFSYTPVRDETGAVAGFFCPCDEITEQVLEERRARLRAALTDRLRELENAGDIMAETVAMMERHFPDTRVSFVEVGNAAVIGWNGSGVPRGSDDRAWVASLGAAVLADLKRGRTIAIDDVRNHRQTREPGKVARFEARAISAMVLVPLTRERGLTAILAVLSETPRSWPAADVSLVEEVAERTWSVLERARANSALRQSEEVSRNILESIADGFMTVGRDWRVTYLNPRGAEFVRPLVGDRSEALGTVFWDLFPESYASGFGSAYRRALREQRPVNVEAYYPPLDRWFDARCYPIAEGLAIHFLDVTERKRAEARLRDSEARFRTITEAMPQMVWSARPDGRPDFFNARWFEFTGAIEPVKDLEAWRNLCHEDDRKEMDERWQRSLRTGEDFGFEYRLRHRTGEYRWVLGRAVAVRDDVDRITRWMGTCTDIHELKRAEQHRRLLIDELNHRVKNMLAVVQSFAHQSFGEDVDPRDGTRAFEGRLMALAAAHDLLAQEAWKQATLLGVVERALKAGGANPQNCEVSGPFVVLPAKAAVTISMALHELTTNAIKYGALSANGGRVQVRWAVSEQAERQLSLVWRETGGPPVEPPTRRGFGSRMIEMALATELHGEVSLEFQREGVRCTLEAPLPGLKDPTG